VADGAAARLAAVRARIAGAAARAGRRADEIALVGVAKRKSAEAVAALAGVGLRHVGENFVQEARAKIPRVAELRGSEAPPLAWHFVGRLQTNKAKLAAELFAQVESVDRAELATALDRHAGLLGRPLDVLLQVNVSGEPQKGGAEPDALPALIGVVRACPHLRLRGLMTVPAASADPEDARPAFARLRALRDALCRGAGGLTLPELSMGMSADLEVAIEEGATIVRVGTALFGPREGR
jgi:pyridoxal phosphate enzyme (YggS family)